MENSDVFQIRNEAKNLTGQARIDKLIEGIGAVNRIIQNGFGDEWTQKALAWVLIDLVKEFVSSGNLNAAEQYYNQLLAIDFYEDDEIISGQIQFLRPKIDSAYQKIKVAEELSKAGKHREALASMERLIGDGLLKSIHHEAYGWVIYRLIKAEIQTLDSIEVRRYLRDYMNLQNERPSMLHSIILNFGLQYSKDHSDFNLLSFFLLWAPENLRHDDITTSFHDGHSIPSLASRVCRELVEKNYELNITELLNKIPSQNSTFYFDDSSVSEAVDLFREPFFWKLYNLYKNGNTQELWRAFTSYSETFNTDLSSEWHSKILSLAERYMTENDSWRFYEFFKRWNPKLLRDQDWKDTEKEGKTYKSIAVKACKKLFEHLKHNDESDLGWVVLLYEQGIANCPDNEWLKRELAIIYDKVHKTEKSIALYKDLAIDLFDKSYYWYEFAKLIKNDQDLKLSMLCKAVLTESNDDFLGDVRIELAHLLFDKGLSSEAGIELNRYKINREKNQWKLSPDFNELSSKIEINKGDNKDLYFKWKGLSEGFAFNEIPWVNLVFIDSFEDKKGKKRFVFSDGQKIEFAVSKRFLNGLEPDLGKVIDFKLKEVVNEIENLNPSWRSPKMIRTTHYKPLIYRVSELDDWSILNRENAVVDYINTEKSVVHAITFSNDEVFFKTNVTKFKPRDLISGRRVIRKVGTKSRVQLLNIHKEENKEPILRIPTQVAIVDGINEAKQLFHFVVDVKIDGIVKYKETAIRPKVGDFIEVRLLSKRDKKKLITRYKVLTVSETSKINDSLMKSAIGEIQLKYKSSYGTLDFHDLDEQESLHRKPDFGFLNDFYIPKHILEQYSIRSNCMAKVHSITDGKKWKVIKLERISADLG